MVIILLSKKKMIRFGLEYFENCRLGIIDVQICRKQKIYQILSAIYFSEIDFLSLYGKMKLKVLLYICTDNNFPVYGMRNGNFSLGFSLFLNENFYPYPYCGPA